jgi:hypothetical protein
MKCVTVFDDSDFPSGLAPLIKMPPAVHGREIEWDADYSPIPVYIKSFPWIGDRTIHLFGVRFSFSRSSEKRSGQTIQYFIVCAVPTLTTLQLAQTRNPVYEPPGWSMQPVNAADCKKESPEHCVGPLPKWKWSDALWPTRAGQLMTFIGQVNLPRNKVTEEYLTYNQTVFLFGSHDSDADVFAITEQSTNFHSAEDHYRDEGKRMEASKAAKKRRKNIKPTQ